MLASLAPKGMLPLPKLLEKRRWIDALDRLSHDFGRKEASKPNQWNWLPLHVACEKGAPLTVVMALVDAYPYALSLQTNVWGWLPLHAACRSNATSDVVQLLVEKYPEGTCKKTKNGVLPLHLACLHGQSLGSITALIDAYDEAVMTEQEEDLCYPLHLACCNTQKSSPAVIRLLLDTYGDAAEKPNHMGNLPVHLACGFGQSYTVIELLLRAYPDGATRRNGRGQLALDVARSNRSLNNGTRIVALLRRTARGVRPGMGGGGGGGAGGGGGDSVAPTVTSDGNENIDISLHSVASDGGNRYVQLRMVTNMASLSESSEPGLQATA